MSNRTFTRVMAAGRIGYGSALLLRPDIPARVFAGTGDRGLATAARLLGGRHIAQGAVTISRPTRGVVAAGALIDVLHMMMDLLLPLSGGERRAARADARVTGSLAALGVLASTIGR